MIFEPVSDHHKSEILALVIMCGIEPVRWELSIQGYTKFMHVPPHRRDEVLDAMLKGLAGC